jgi:hypothetical protein
MMEETSAEGALAILEVAEITVVGVLETSSYTTAALAKVELEKEAFL